MRGIKKNRPERSNPIPGSGAGGQSRQIIRRYLPRSWDFFLRPRYIPVFTAPSLRELRRNSAKPAGEPESFRGSSRSGRNVRGDVM